MGSTPFPILLFSGIPSEVLMAKSEANHRLDPVQVTHERNSTSSPSIRIYDVHMEKLNLSYTDVKQMKSRSPISLLTEFPLGLFNVRVVITNRMHYLFLIYSDK
jgi:hypothetical protein